MSRAQILIQKASRLFPASHSGIRSLPQLQSKVHRLPYPEPPEGVGGWMAESERQALYSLVRFTHGPILEVGSWLGLSTIYVAKAIQDSGETREFTTCEFGPTLENFRPLGERIGFYYPPSSQVPMGICSRELFMRDIHPVLSHPEGLVGQLRNNLHSAGVDGIVNVFVGDFRDLPAKPYPFVFLDTMHDEAEITRNAPDLQPFLRTGTILACHDSSPENEAVLRRFINFGYSFTVGSLFVGEVISQRRSN